MLSGFLIGSVGGPRASLSASTLIFDATVVGQTSAAETVVLTNTGAATLHVESITASGDYAVVSEAPETLAPRASHTIEIVFEPTVAAGTRFGTLTVVSDAPDSPTTAELLGTGLAVARTLAVDPTELDFGSVTVDATSDPLTVIIEADGNSTVTISEVSVTGDFALVGAAPASLDAGETADLSVTFTPTEEGSLEGTLTITSDATGSPHTVDLAGSGQGPTAVPVIEASATAAIAGYVELNGSVAVDTSAADALLVFVSVVSEHAWDPTVTHNGDALTLLARIKNENTLWVFGRAGPDQLGAGTVAVTSANYPGPGAIIAVALSGVDQSTPWEDSATAYGNPTATPSVDTAGADRLLVACGSNRFTGSSAPLTASGYTAIVSNTADAAHIVTALSRAADTAGSYSAAVTTSTNGVTAALVAVKPA